MKEEQRHRESIDELIDLLPTRLGIETFYDPVAHQQNDTGLENDERDNAQRGRCHV